MTLAVVFGAYRPHSQPDPGLMSVMAGWCCQRHSFVALRCLLRRYRYVGDDTGRFHKITGVFKGSPVDSGSPWPVTVASGVILDQWLIPERARTFLLVAAMAISICVAATGVACSTPSISVALGTAPGPVLDVPILDGTQQTVFAAASNSSSSVLMQATTSLSSPIRATVGASGTLGFV